MRFGGVLAVRDVNFTLGERELRCLIGPNGAGKSTFFKMLTGQLKPTSGTVLLRGEEVTGAEPHDIARRGVGIKTQVPSVFDGLTVRTDDSTKIISGGNSGGRMPPAGASGGQPPLATVSVGAGQGLPGPQHGCAISGYKRWPVPICGSPSRNHSHWNRRSVWLTALRRSSARAHRSDRCVR